MKLILILEELTIWQTHCRAPSNDTVQRSAMHTHTHMHIFMDHCQTEILLAQKRRNGVKEQKSKTWRERKKEEAAADNNEP